VRTVITLFDSPHKGMPFPAPRFEEKNNYMNLHVESPHKDGVEIPEALVHKKFEHFDKLYDRIEYCNVVLYKEKSDDTNDFFVEASMKVPRSTLFSSNRAGSFEMAIDKAVNDLESQLRRHKEKLRQHR
jgi:putative sigma-54 modulation protein